MRIAQHRDARLKPSRHVKANGGVNFSVRGYVCAWVAGVTLLGVEYEYLQLGLVDTSLNRAEKGFAELFELDEQLHGCVLICATKHLKVLAGDFQPPLLSASRRSGNDGACQEKHRQEGAHGKIHKAKIRG